MAITPNGGQAAAPLPSSPFINAPGLVNLRDAGGYAVSSSSPHKAIRRGVLYRSADLTDLNDGGAAALQRLGITRVFDLRSIPEQQKAGEPRLWDGATRESVPVFLAKDYSPEAIALRYGDYGDGPEGFVRAYAAILAAAADPSNPYAPFRSVLKHLASPTTPLSPILVHCTAGKDRTGVLVALVLSLCGLDDDAIAAEYSLTDAGLAPRRPQIVQRLVQSEALLGDRARAERMVAARKESMLQTLAMINQRYGSVERYVIDELGLSPADVDQIRRNLVVDVPEGEKPLDWRSLADINGEPHL